MKSIKFIFGIHNHQPVGNFPEVLEKGYQEAYKPFMDVMSHHPKIKWSLHMSGILWDFVIEKHKEYVDAVKKMTESGQLELLTGGYYEPIIPTIPDRDKLGQIAMLTDFIRQTFNVTPRGMWLAERVWEPHLPKILARAGVEYTVVDDAHFAAAGKDVERLRGYYLSEDEGVNLKIFPINQRLRYYLPFEVVEKSIEYFTACASESGAPVLVMADDGEKFGLWPETNKHVYKDKWLDNFLSAMDKNLSWIEPVTFSEYAAKNPPEGRIYLPTASYFEMSEWSLPSDAQEVFQGVVKRFRDDPSVTRFLRGGFWRNFLTKYAESNNMHKKMLYVSEKISGLKESERPPAAVKALYEGQCNCAYWHGVFGGLYLPHLRSAVYQKLIEAESLCPRAPREGVCREFDFDKDGRDEVVFESAGQNLYFSPHSGGSLFEWDFLEKKTNLLNVLTRRQEAYHGRLRDFLAHPEKWNNNSMTINDIVKVKEQNLGKYLSYDWYRRASLVDHFLHENTKCEDFMLSTYGEQGDFVLGEYAFEKHKKALVFKRRGIVWKNDYPQKVELSKEITPQDEGLKIFYRIKNLENREVSFVFAPEFNFSFSCRTEQDSIILKDVHRWIRRDEVNGLHLEVELGRASDFWVFPIETVSISEGGFERTYQGTVVLVVKKMVLKAAEEYVSEITVRTHND
ncbi:MAG: DUF1926 domain-containing protein [Endomicrobiales bacterium]|nr:DUF1926 domain-containing protein [Endomicrobiales bacterium]